MKKICPHCNTLIDYAKGTALSTCPACGKNMDKKPQEPKPEKEEKYPSKGKGKDNTFSGLNFSKEEKPEEKNDE